MCKNFDLAVIGGGPGGYVAAIKAAQLGKSVALIENDLIGGTCLNRGCIPTKAMLHAAECYREAKNGNDFGIIAENVSYDFSKIMEYKDETSETLRNGVEQLLKANNVTIVKGTALLNAEKKEITVSGEEVIAADKIIIATGSRPAKLPIEGIDLPGVMNSNDVFNLKSAPKSMIIIGGGVIGTELATVFQDLECQVTIIEALPRLLANMDKEFGQSLKMSLKKKGVDIHTGAALQKITKSDDGFICEVLEKDKLIELEAECVLCAVGRVANTEGLFSGAIVPDMQKSMILVSDNYETSISGIYAIGDVIPGIQLAHTASAEATVAVEKMFGEESHLNPLVIPSCVYTGPEIASVGMTEEDAKAQSIAYRTGKFIMTANGKSLITKEERGFIKVIVDENDYIIGAQMMCARATDMIGEMATSIANKLKKDDLLKAMKAHPTYNEGLLEAIEDIDGKAVHIAPKKKRKTE